MPKAKKTKKQRYVYKSAKTGKIVTKKYADSHPTTTYKEAV